MMVQRTPCLALSLAAPFLLLRCVQPSTAHLRRHRQLHGDHLGPEASRRLPGGIDDSELHGDIFDSCLVAHRSDIVDRYGDEFADQLEVDGFHFEPEDGGDLMASRDKGGLNTTARQQRALHRVLGATNLLHRLWTVPENRGDDGLLRIPYAVKDTPWFTNETRSAIFEAMRHIEASTGVIKFAPRAPPFGTVEYIFFNHEARYERSCAANLGKQTGKRTNVYLGWCRERRHVGNIIHELLHSLGFWHEHSRPDRDEYVSIRWDYVRSSAVNNFQKATNVNDRGSPYDFNSIMHYPSVSFSTDARVQTIVPVERLEHWETMGQRVQLSEHDVEQLRLLYQCASGPREGAAGVEDLCSVDCPCWENAQGECDSDAECMGDLVCGDAPDPEDVKQLLARRRRVNRLPYREPGAGASFSCDDFCHAACCRYPNSVVLCPETCGSAPPAGEMNGLPDQMCVSVRVGGGATRTATTSTQATMTTAATVISTTTTAVSSGSPPWYVNWSKDKCVQYCVGPSPCGGLGANAILHVTARKCCDAHLGYKVFEECHASEGQTETSGPTTRSTGEPATLSPPWYVKWSIDKCVQYCVGPPPCGGLVSLEGNITLHVTARKCCDAHLDYKVFEECRASESRADTSEPSPHSAEGPATLPTISPSARPITDSPTVVPTSPPSSKPSAGLTARPTRIPSRSPTFHPTAEPTKQPTRLPSRGPTFHPTAGSVGQPKGSAEIVELSTRMFAANRVGEGIVFTIQAIKNLEISSLSIVTDGDTYGFVQVFVREGHYGGHTSSNEGWTPVFNRYVHQRGPAELTRLGPLMNDQKVEIPSGSRASFYVYTDKKMRYQYKDEWAEGDLVLDSSEIKLYAGIALAYGKWEDGCDNTADPPKDRQCVFPARVFAGALEFSLTD